MPDRRFAGPWRVEWHVGDHVTVVACLDEGYAHHTALEPVITRLQLAGHREGLLALVDGASGAVAARRRLDRPVYRAPRAPARPKRPPIRLSGPPLLPASGDAEESRTAAD